MRAHTSRMKEALREGRGCAVDERRKGKPSETASPFRVSRTSESEGSTVASRERLSVDVLAASLPVVGEVVGVFVRARIDAEDDAAAADAFVVGFGAVFGNA